MTYQQPRSGDMALLRKKAQVQAARARIEAEARERERQAATQQNERIDAAKRVNAATQAMLIAKTSPATIRRQQLEKRVDDAAKQADAALRVANGKRNMRLAAARKLVAEEASTGRRRQYPDPRR